MDLEEWEYLPDHGFMDSKEEEEKLLRTPQLEPIIGKDTPLDHDDDDEQQQQQQQKEEQQPKEVIKNIIIKRGPAESDQHQHHDDEDQDSISQVFFKKMKENEFVDMKILDSPKSPASVKSISQLDPSGFDFDDEGIDFDHQETEKKMIDISSDDHDHGGGLMNLWKWGLTGIGAICSFGVAAATICIIVIGNQQGKKQRQNQKLCFQIYSDDKRIKQVVQHATKLNEAISAARGVPITRAHITYGGYYDGI